VPIRSVEAKTANAAALRDRLAAPKSKPPKMRRCRSKCGECEHCRYLADIRLYYRRKRRRPVKCVSQVDDIIRMMDDPDYCGPCPSPQSIWSAFEGFTVWSDGLLLAGSDIRRSRAFAAQP
jgi:hypothetical protein